MSNAIIKENGESRFAVTIQVSGHEILGDEPLASGGGDLGPAPYDMLTAALGECTAMTVRWYAEREKWPLDEVEVFVQFRKERIDGHPYPVDIFEKQIVLHGDKLTDAQRRKLLDVANKGPVQRTMEGAPRITTVLK